MFFSDWRTLSEFLRQFNEAEQLAHSDYHQSATDLGDANTPLAKVRLRSDEGDVIAS
jgi:hypothetical protein